MSHRNQKSGGFETRGGSPSESEALDKRTTKPFVREPLKTPPFTTGKEYNLLAVLTRVLTSSAFLEGSTEPIWGKGKEGGIQTFGGLKATHADGNWGKLFFWACQATTCGLFQRGFRHRGL